MYDLNYVNPKSTSEALSEYEKSSEGQFLAGGMTLIPTLKSRLSSSDLLVDLRDTNLSGINSTGNNLNIKAMTTHAEVSGSDEVKKTLPAIANLAGQIGDHMVRNRGTIGGSVANNDPSACYPSAILSLNATIVTNKREIKADDFFVGLFETSLDEGELITEFSIPIPQKASYAKFANPASRYAIVGVFVSQNSDNVRVAVTGAGQNGVFRPKEIEDALNKNFSSGALEGINLDNYEIFSDIHAQSDYRSHLVIEMTKQAVNNIS
jgi:carbon-monoxide dehydrogenase medium subunit